jgi:hypothetical protein
MGHATRTTKLPLDLRRRSQGDPKVSDFSRKGASEEPSIPKDNFSMSLYSA